ncbi:MAG: hypothetical protein Q4A83_04315 [Bacillota bacterium]|nr:hypothetical protein [Bacillota bacterium]
MKKIGFGKLGLAFAGSFLGAGYVSGQELWQFFGSFGKNGIAGLCAAIALLFVMGVMMTRLNQLTGFADADKLVVYRDSAPLRAAVVALESVFLFGVAVIMSAGVGALSNQLFGLPLWVGSLVFIIVVSAISLAGLSGMVSAFSLTVPVLVGVTLLFGVLSLIKGGFSMPDSASHGSNPLMSSWLIAAISFACYNVFGSIAIVAPLGGHVKSKSHTYFGLGLGAALLFTIAVSVLISMGAYPDAVSAELPMLALASSLNEYLGYIYALLLLLAMFGTALSSLVAFTNLLCLKSKKLEANRIALVIGCAVLVFFGSLFGFGDLIGVIYPIFGYLSSVFIILMAVHYYKVRKKVKA